MAFWPVSFSFELLFFVIWYLLLKEGLLSRTISFFAAIGEIPLLAARQVLWVESGGVTSYQSLVYPSVVTQIAALIFVGLAYASIAEIFAFFNRDMFGRKTVVMERYVESTT